MNVTSGSKCVGATWLVPNLLFGSRGTCLILLWILFFQGVLCVKWHRQLPSLGHKHLLIERPWGYCSGGFQLWPILTLLFCNPSHSPPTPTVIRTSLGTCLGSPPPSHAPPPPAQRHPPAKVRRKVSSKNHQNSPHWKSTHQASLKGRIAHENAPKDTKITLCNWWCWWCSWGWWWASLPASTGWHTENQCHHCWW